MKKIGLGRPFAIMRKKSITYMLSISQGSWICYTKDIEGELL